MTTKNKHHHRPACAGLWPQVFRGGPFGVWGTPPPKPLNCKVWEILDGALATHACRSGSGLSTSKSVADPFVFVSTNKKPRLLFGKQGIQKSVSSFTCLPPVYPD